MEFDFLELMPVLIALGMLLLALAALGTVVIVLRRQYVPEEDASPNELLSEFRRARESGQMTDDEYRRVKSILGDKIRRDAGIGVNDAPEPNDTDSTVPPMEHTPPAPPSHSEPTTVDGVEEIKPRP